MATTMPPATTRPEDDMTRSALAPLPSIPSRPSARDTARPGMTRREIETEIAYVERAIEDRRALEASWREDRLASSGTPAMESSRQTMALTQRLQRLRAALAAAAHDAHDAHATAEQLGGA